VLFRSPYVVRCSGARAVPLRSAVGSRAGPGVLGLPQARGRAGAMPMAGVMAGAMAGNAERRRQAEAQGGPVRRRPVPSPARWMTPLGVDLYLDRTNGMDLEKVLTQSCDIEHSTFSFREV